MSNGVAPRESTLDQFHYKPPVEFPKLKDQVVAKNFVPLESRLAEHKQLLLQDLLHPGQELKGNNQPCQ
jgi:hypothetical protein